VPPTEAVIALSIAFMAREAIVSARTPPMPGQATIRPRYLAVVVAFGLLHGLGFASALGELGIGPEERIAGLVFFNVGVEIGQLLFVSVVALAMWSLRRLRIDRPARTALLGLAGSVGACWTVARLAGFLL
ncbi:MAG TPA: HupE/UreJ family protein, partial [Rhizomicrobium sp.]|nr:HupE/UreJ family protein [Rhizomicrobium sp.]